MIAMNKVLKIIERYFDTLLRAHGNGVLMTLDRDPWTMSKIPTRRRAALDSARSSTARTTKVQRDCTVSGQMTVANDPAGLALVKDPAANQDSDSRRSAALIGDVRDCR